MKEDKFNTLVEDVTYFIADWHYKSFHRIFFEDIEKAFPEVKKKHLKKVWKELYQ